MKNIYNLLLLTLLIGCGNSKQSVVKSNEKAIDSVSKQSTMVKDHSFEVLVESAHGGYNDPKILVIKEASMLSEVYGKINMTRKPGYPYPQVDFEKEMIIAIFMGEKNVGGYGVQIDHIQENDDTLSVYVKETSPGEMAMTVMCQPFSLVKMARSDKKMNFEKILK
jgi:hypothetical protein